MKKSLVIITLLLVLVSAFSVNALVTKRTAMWGFGMKVTGMAAADAVCYDSDNSSGYDMKIYTPTPQQRPDAYVFGIVNYILPTGSIFVKDACYNGTHMAEQFCQQGKYKGTQGITCANGCRDGACLVNPVTTVLQTCTDSDNGMNELVQGSVLVNITATGAANMYSDTCVGQTRLTEYYCPNATGNDFGLGNFYGTAEFNCAYGCSNGACLPPPVITPACHDVEANFHISGPGTTYNPFRIQLNSAVVFIVNNVEYLVNFSGINDSTATFLVNGQQISLRPPQTKMLANGVSFRLLRLNNTPVCGSDGNNYESACLAGAAGAAVSCSGQCPCPPLACEGLEMVWKNESRRRAYAYSLDDCAGYRCLSGNEISPSCYNAVTCPAACTGGTCVSIPAAKQQCPPIVCSDSDGGINTSVKGYLKAGFGGGSDCCAGPKGCTANGSSVTELYCSPNNPNGFDSITLPCSNGCQNGACITSQIILGPPPAPVTAGEQVTCNFLFAKSTSTCSSSKGRCSAPRNYPKCTIQVSGTPGEKINWTSTCTVLATAVTTIDGANENAVFICGQPPRINQPAIRFP